MFRSDQVHWVYLDELGEIAELQLGVAAMVLTSADESAIERLQQS